MIRIQPPEADFQRLAPATWAAFNRNGRVAP